MKITKQEVNNANLFYWILMLATVLLIIPDVCALFGLIYFIFLIASAASNKKFLSSHAWQALIVFAPIFIHSIIFRPSSQFGIQLLIRTAIGIAAAVGGLFQTGKGNSWIGNIHAEIIEDKDKPAINESVPPPSINNGSLRDQIYSNLNLKTTEELSQIVEADDRTTWSAAALDIARDLLSERTTAAKRALQKFQSDDSAEREAGQRELEQLDEVEIF